MLSIATAESRQQAYITFYYRPQRAPKTTFSLQRPMWGTSGVPLGDAELDAHYLMTAGAPEEVLALLNPPARAHLLQYAAETWSLSLHAGTWTYVQVGTLFDAQARDRVLDLLRLLAAPHDAHGLRHRHV